MTDTLTQVEMQRLYERGCPVVCSGIPLEPHVTGSIYWLSPLTPTALMLGACHDLTREIWGGWTRVHYYQVSATQWVASAKLSGGNTPCEEAISSASLLHALVALWRKMKDEQEKQKPSEPEKVGARIAATTEELHALRDNPIEPLLYEYAKSDIQTATEAIKLLRGEKLSEPEKVIDTEQESVAILVAAQAKRIHQLQSDVATLAKLLQGRYPFTDSSLTDIFTRNRKES